MSAESSLAIGLRSARSLLLPAALLLVAATALVISYHRVPAVAEVFAHVAETKGRLGFLFAFGMNFCLIGTVPWAFRMALPSLRPAKPFREYLFGAFWWGFIGLTVDAFYRSLGLLFDDSGLPPAGIIACKTLTDFFVFTPIVAAPLNSLAHMWKELDFDFQRLRRATGPGLGWYRRIVVPNLIPNWMLWGPGVVLVYSMPSNLQFPLSSLIGCFWALMCIQVAAHSKGRVTVEPVEA